MVHMEIPRKTEVYLLNRESRITNFASLSYIHRVAIELASRGVAVYFIDFYNNTDSLETLLADEIVSMNINKESGFNQKLHENIHICKFDKEDPNFGFDKFFYSVEINEGLAKEIVLILDNRDMLLKLVADMYNIVGDHYPWYRILTSAQTNISNEVISKTSLKDIQFLQSFPPVHLYNIRETSEFSGDTTVLDALQKTPIRSMESLREYYTEKREAAADEEDNNGSGESKSEDETEVCDSTE